MSNGQIIVDDLDAQLAYTGHWTVAGTDAHYGQSLHSSSEKDASVTFEFTGTSISLIGDNAGVDACSILITLDEDESTPVTIAASPSPHQPLWSSPSLSDKKHTLVYSSAACSDVWLDYVLYTPSPKIWPSGARFAIDDTSSQLEWEGKVLVVGEEDDSNFNHTAHVLREDDSLRLTFTGTWAAAYGRGATNDSTVQTAVALDGADPEVYETSPTSANIELFNTGNIAQQEHSLVMSSIANSHISIDYFIVRSEPPKGQAAAVEADTEEKKGGVSGGIIAAAVVGGILLIIIIGVRYWFWRRKKRTPASREFTKSVPTLTPKPFTSSRPTYPPTGTVVSSPSSFGHGLDLGMNQTRSQSSGTGSGSGSNSQPRQSRSRAGTGADRMDFSSFAYNATPKRGKSPGRAPIQNQATRREFEGDDEDSEDEVHVDAQGRPVMSMSKGSASVTGSARARDPYNTSRGVPSSYNPPNGRPSTALSGSDHSNSETTSDGPGRFAMVPNRPRTKSASSNHSANARAAALHAVNVEPDLPALTWPTDVKDRSLFDSSSNSSPASTSPLLSSSYRSAYPSPPASAVSRSMSPASRPLPSTTHLRSDDGHSTSTSDLLRPSEMSSPSNTNSNTSSNIVTLSVSGISSSPRRPARPLPSSAEDAKRPLNSDASSSRREPVALPRAPPLVHTDSGLRIPANQAHTSHLPAASNHVTQDVELPDELPPMYTPR